jgi:hypothetical protein
VSAGFGRRDADLEHQPAIILDRADHHLVVELDAAILECRDVDDKVANWRVYGGWLTPRVLDLERERHPERPSLRRSTRGRAPRTTRKLQPMLEA